MTDKNEELIPEEVIEKNRTSKMYGVQFLRRAKFVGTGIESPIQGPALDEKPLFNFIRQNHDSMISKVRGVFLDENHTVLGIEALVFGDSATPEKFNEAMKVIFHYFSAFFPHVLLSKFWSRDYMIRVRKARLLSHKLKRCMAIGMAIL